MSIKEATYKKQFIQKFKGTFKDIRGGSTVLYTKTIQSIRDPNCLAVYVYLASKPPEWKINVKELMSHFIKMGRDKVYGCLNDLCLIGLLERKERRNDSGKFTEYVYYLYLEPLPENQELALPLPGLPDTANPLPENQETYKEKRSCIKRKDNKKALIKTPSIFEQQQYSFYLKESKEIPEEYIFVKEWLNKREKPD